MPRFGWTQAGCTFKTFNSTRTMNRIERGQIGKFHRETAGRAAHLGGDFFDDRIIAVKTAKRQFAVEIERHEQMFSRPFDRRSFCHVARLPSFILKLKPENHCPAYLMN